MGNQVVVDNDFCEGFMDELNGWFEFVRRQPNGSAYLVFYGESPTHEEFKQAWRFIKEKLESSQSENEIFEYSRLLTSVPENMKTKLEKFRERVDELRVICVLGLTVFFYLPKKTYEEKQLATQDPLVCLIGLVKPDEVTKEIDTIGWKFKNNQKTGQRELTFHKLRFSISGSCDHSNSVRKPTSVVLRKQASNELVVVKNPYSGGGFKFVNVERGLYIVELCEGTNVLASTRVHVDKNDITMDAIVIGTTSPSA